jgi:hypothetical protein
MDSETQFTIALTVSRRVEFLPHALQCIAWQTYPGWKLIVLEDGVHLAARGIVASWLKAHPAFQRTTRYFECVQPSGICGPWGHPLRRKALEMASTSYICWLNHDNLIAPSYLQRHSESIAKAPSKMCVSLVDVDYWNGRHFVKRLPDCKSTAPVALPPEDVRSLRIGDLDLLNIALPVEPARTVGAFSEKYDNVKEAGYHALEQLAQTLPVYFHSCDRSSGAHF